MSKNQQEIQEFLETASPVEIMQYWQKQTAPKNFQLNTSQKIREFVRNPVARKDIDRTFDELFSASDLAPTLYIPLPGSPRIWFRLLRQWLRRRQIFTLRTVARHDAVAWAKHWRLGPPPVLQIENRQPPPVQVVIIKDYK